VDLLIRATYDAVMDLVARRIGGDQP
jgi:hypothetical protein